MKKIIVSALSFCVLTMGPAFSSAQQTVTPGCPYNKQTQQGSIPQAGVSRPNWTVNGKPVLFTAGLVDPQKNAQERAATVKVDVQGIRLVDPEKMHEQPIAGEGHIHYMLDGGPVVATPDPKISFHELSPGTHTITVMLAGNDHRPLGPQQTLTVNIP